MHFRKRTWKNKAFRRPAVHMKAFSPKEHPDQPFVRHAVTRCLWANEGIVYGFRQRRRRRVRGTCCCAAARLPPDSELRQRYAKYAVPPEEAEWIGLSLAEACKKQLKLESRWPRSRRRPPCLKKIELMRRLREPQNSARGSSCLVTWP
uniref:Uncharacterized protein n=1 Tax=Macrostomum lignano TaxID=282301 RepID=A0A1I8FEV2_9PLAT